MREVRAQLARLAGEEGPVLLRGGPGSGKALAARILHYSSTRSGPFVTLACGAFGAGSLERELFGSPTQADAGGGAETHGALQQAQGGTLFLQDVERLPAPLQERLLEALWGVRQRPGAERIDVRLLAGTRIDLGQAAAQGRFLNELARRLAERTLVLPALKDRSEDIELTGRHLLARHARFEDARFAPTTVWLLGQHDWPGNVRELEATVQEACSGARAAEIGVEDLPRPFVELQRKLEQKGVRPTEQAAPAAARVPAGLEPDPRLDPIESPGSLLEAYEKQALLHALRLKRGDKLAAAKLLEVGKSTFYRKLKQYGIT